MHLTIVKTAYHEEYVPVLFVLLVESMIQSSFVTEVRRRILRVGISVSKNIISIIYMPTEVRQCAQLPLKKSSLQCGLSTRAPGSTETFFFLSCYQAICTSDYFRKTVH